MTARTGLGPLEVAVLEAVAASGAEQQSTELVLARLEASYGIAPSYAYPVLCDLTAWWRVHLRLLDHRGGNWGSPQGDPPADARYTTARLSPLGELALASERGEVGPTPFGLIDGTLYKGSRVPPMDPGRLTSTLAATIDDPAVTDERLVDLVGPPAMSTGGTVSGDLLALYAGESTWLDLGCRVVHEDTAAGPALVIVGTPLGVSLDEIERYVASRAQADATAGDRRFRAYLTPEAQLVPLPGRLVARVNDESTMHVGTRIVVVAKADADLDELETWLHSVWPVTVQAECRFSAPTAKMLRDWTVMCRGDRSGLDRLIELLS